MVTFFGATDFAFKTYVAARPVATGPTSKDQCKKGGWKKFTDPSFKNQGQCVKFVNHQAKAGKGKVKDEKGNGRKKRNSEKK